MMNAEHNLTFFYQPNKARKSEANFFYMLQNHFSNSEIVNEHFGVSQNLIDELIDVESFICWLQADTLLPLKKRQASIQFLQNFPSKSLRVAREPKEISFDVVARVDQKVFYWEFHEKQHANLSVDRSQRVYTLEGQPVLAPRYFQRLVRDIWRTLFFCSYTIVWQNWFEAPGDKTEAFQLKDESREFHLPDKFSFKKFLSK